MTASFSLGYWCPNETCCNSSNHYIDVCVCVCVCVYMYVWYVMGSKAVLYSSVYWAHVTVLLTSSIKRSQSAFGMSKLVHKGSLFTEPKASQLEPQSCLGATEDNLLHHPNGYCFLFTVLRAALLLWLSAESFPCKLATYIHFRYFLYTGV